MSSGQSVLTSVVSWSQTSDRHVAIMCLTINAATMRVACRVIVGVVKQFHVVDVHRVYMFCRCCMYLRPTARAT